MNNNIKIRQPERFNLICKLWRHDFRESYYEISKVKLTCKRCGKVIKTKYCKEDFLF